MIFTQAIGDRAQTLKIACIPWIQKLKNLPSLYQISRCCALFLSRSQLV
ncbi:hypothetical protein [Microcoleus sp. herbarium14]